jgi:adenosylhomocysteine nucleosidase
MDTIGLIAAMPQESNALSSQLKEWKRVKLGRFDCKSFELYERNCLLVTSGMGIRRASQAALELIETKAPRLLISFGIAGAVEADLVIGDVVAVEDVCRIEEGITNPLMQLNHWPDPALKAASQVLAGRGVRLFTGTAVTTGGSQVFENQLNGIKHPILEMETAGIAQVAAQKRIPLLALRAISDGPCEHLPFDLGKVMDKEANLRLGRIMMALVQQPRIVLQLRDLMRNTRIAADNAAVAIIAAISQLTI